MYVRGEVFDRSSFSHLLVRCQLLLQLSVFVVPHQIVDRVTTLLRSFLSRNHPRIILCNLFLHCVLQGYFGFNSRYITKTIILYRCPKAYRESLARQKQWMIPTRPALNKCQIA